MTKETMKEAIVRFVEDKGGCKATELVPYIASEYPAESGFLFGLLEEMIQKRELVEIEYSLGAMPWRVKSFLLPKGSQVSWRSLIEKHG